MRKILWWRLLLWASAVCVMPAFGQYPSKPDGPPRSIVLQDHYRQNTFVRFTVQDGGLTLTPGAPGPGLSALHFRGDDGKLCRVYVNAGGLTISPDGLSGRFHSSLRELVMADGQGGTDVLHMAQSCGLTVTH